MSRAEEDLIAEVFAQHGHKSRWELVRLTHDLPYTPGKVREFCRRALGKS